MMAESVDLYAVAWSILDRDDTWPFLEFEDYGFELDRPWSGTSRTVKDMLFGHAGKFRQHVKDEVNRLGWIDEAAGREAVLRFLCLIAVWSGDRHFGMPDWDRVVDHAVAHLSCPADPCWDERGYELASRRLPRRFIEQSAEFGAVLRRDPGSLGPEVLGDLIASGLFMWRS